MTRRIFRRALLAGLAACVLMGRAAKADMPIDPNTLAGKLITGYQGWFACPGDAAGLGWVHWFDRRRPTFDMLPDVGDVPAAGRCDSPLDKVGGGHFTLFTDQAAATVDQHFAWMQHYGLDGVALQRFATVLLHADIAAAFDRILANVGRSAEAHGRVFFLMYDLSGMPPDKLSEVVKDWARLEGQHLTASPAYLRHRAHPLLGLWGLGFGGRPMRPANALDLFDALEKASAPYGGLTILGGVPLGWRTGTRGADPDPGWQAVWRRLGVISPWTVGAYHDDTGADAYRGGVLVPDMAAAKSLGADFMPVVFPGFSWANLMTARHLPEKAIRNQIPRRCGRFYWHQVFNAVSAGAGMIYGAMFDEVDEGTAMFKLVPSAADVPAGKWFLTLDADGCKLHSDFYLRLAGAATASVHKRQILESMPYP